MSRNNYPKRHDSFFKQLMHQPEIAIDLCKQHLPEIILEKIDLNTLKPIDKEFIDKSLRKQLIDKLFEVNIEGEKGYVYILADHQRSPDKLMPWRLICYIVEIIKSHMNKYNSKKLPIVYPIVFYNGKTKYKHSLNIFDLFGEMQELAQAIYSQPFQLVDLNEINDDEYRKYIWSAILSLPMKWINSYETIEELPRHVLKQIMHIARKLGGGDLHEVCLYYLACYLEIAGDSDLMAELVEDIDLEEEAMGGYIGRRIKESREEGREQGREQGETLGIVKGKVLGIQQRNHEIAKGLVSQGIEFQVIATVTGLTVAEIEQLQSESVDS